MVKVIERLSREVVVSLDHIKALLKIGSPDEDALLQGYIATSIEEVEHYTNLGLFLRRMEVETIPPKRMKGSNVTRLPLPLGPVTQVDAVKVVDVLTGKELMTLGPQDYKLHIQGVHTSLMIHEPIPRGCGVRAQYVGGYAKIDDLPHSLSQALMMLVISFYDAMNQPGALPKESLPLPVRRLLKWYAPQRTGVAWPA